MVQLEDILKKMQSGKISANDCYKNIIKIEDKIKHDLNLLFEGLGGTQIHDILSKIGYIKNLINMVVESKGRIEYQGSLKSATTQLEEILALYKKSGVSTVIS